MKKKSIILMALVAILPACIKEGKVIESNPVTITARIPEEGLAKVSLTPDSNPDNALKRNWEETDFITIRDHNDASKAVVFNYVSGAGSRTGHFRANGGTATIDGAEAYDIILTSKMPGGFQNQTQAADGTTDHLGFSASIIGVDDYLEDLEFSASFADDYGGSFESSSVLRIRAQMPTAAMADAVRKVTIKSSLPIFDDEKFVSIAITTPGVSGDSKVVTVYATLPAGTVSIPAGTELLYQFQVSEDPEDKYTACRIVSSATTLAGGKVNAFKIDCPNIESYANQSNSDIGTSSNPYLVGDRHQMDYLHNIFEANVQKYVRMVDDVNLGAIASWTPLVNDTAYFIDFDGDGHTISNLKVNAAGQSYTYPSFMGFLRGLLHDVTFDNAAIDGGDKNYTAVGAGYIGVTSLTGECRNVTVNNSSVTSTGSSVGGLGGYVRKGAGTLFYNCHVVNTSVSGSSNVGGLLGYLQPNTGVQISDSSTENIMVTNTGNNIGGLIGTMEGGVNVIIRCHSTGQVGPKSGSGHRYTGGLVGSISNGETQIVNSYSTCNINGYQFTGGLVGQITAVSDGKFHLISHCFASGDIVDPYGNSGDGGLVGLVNVSGVKILNSVAWNGKIYPHSYGSGNYSTGAVVGRTHPNCILTDNYRRPGMDLRAYWVPQPNFDHPNVNGTTAPLWRVTAEAAEAGTYDEGATTTLTAFGDGYSRWAYHGKHLASGASVSPDNKLGWTSPDIAGNEDSDPEDPSFPNSINLNYLSGATTKTIRSGVTWTTFHGTWQGETRNINILVTDLSNSHNTMGFFSDYNGLAYLDQYCIHEDAIGGTNGSMACCQFLRVNYVVAHGGSGGEGDPTQNAAFTLDGDGTIAGIVKVNGNGEAAILPNQNVACAGPMLVWKGAIQSPDKSGDANWYDRTHPRTAIGLSKDGKKVVQVTVDGRWGYKASTGHRAIGMSTDLLSTLMKGLGCYKAMNLDGGGGTAMWVYGEGRNDTGIVNHPADNIPQNQGYSYSTNNFNSTYYNSTDASYWNSTTLRSTLHAIYVKSDLK